VKSKFNNTLHQAVVVRIFGKLKWLALMPGAKLQRPQITRLSRQRFLVIFSVAISIKVKAMYALY